MSDEGNEMRDMVVEDCHDKMRKAIEHLKDEFGAVRTGRAQPGPRREAARSTTTAPRCRCSSSPGFSVPEPRVLVISPYDKSAIKAIEKAIQSSATSGSPPSNDGAVIRLVVPAAHRGAAQGAREGREAPGRGGPGRGAQRPPPGPPRPRGAARRTATSPRTSSTGSRRTSRSTPTRSIAEIDELLDHKEQELLEV